MKKRQFITLLFNANKVYDRQIIEGVGEYLQASQAEWDIFIEEDFRTRKSNIAKCLGDGVIADFDDPEIRELLKDVDIPVVAVGGSYKDKSRYPDVPYVGTDNYSLVKAAFDHLKGKGLEQFAFYGLPDDDSALWSKEREHAFTAITREQGYRSSVYTDGKMLPESWQYDINRLTDWVQRLPTPVGIIAATDSRARHLLQVCERINLMVPDQVSIIGIDNEEVARYLTRVSLSSVCQGCKEIGHAAARRLARLLNGETLHQPRILVPAVGVVERQSTDYQAIRDPYVSQAMHFIRQNVSKYIKVYHVLDHLGISRTNIEARFKEQLGTTVHTEIHNARLNKALSLLGSTELPINEISTACGYPSLQYMYSVIKKNTGFTPREYRDGHAHS
ncbi:DNA-binding transcriptional regulator [Photobacterium sp. OFAV2-7]|uniref:XylR family transcriptional regulator n=1 Tax=Photobacterium sp. OFAV2-7 TaxID=2917748 RepID=UPI001EF6B5B0|nr:DNA-binding transcriptional regulator [Photobacterium sp. OFAV2-7]MCG7585421.1 DNA-binding transcriptional regulator [Photobacterium sp. OFAV2-7]